MKKSSDTNRSWFIVGRWQEFDGEGRANLVRVLALVVFFGVQLIRHQFIDTEDPAASTFHRHSTLVVVAWSLVCLAVLVCLQRKIFPAWLKYFSTAADLTLLTALAQVGGGTQSALVQVYYLVIGLAALRFRVGLVWFATLASMAGYLSLVAGHDKTWFDAEHATPVVQQLVTLVSLAMAGVIAGQVVRKAQAMAHEYADRA
ncbi:MAG TPA: hypothetical protein VL096_03440, partial [Pirellulaceae bacterium]|nr:hypothetical protein [Pirellulaceae bacterium]